MTQPSEPADRLIRALRRDFRAADLGDTAEEFTDRVEYLAAQALARTGATPAQQEAGARYHLIGAQIRHLSRQAEELKAASGASIRRNITAQLAALRQDQATQHALSGLAAARPARGTISVPVEVVW